MVQSFGKSKGKFLAFRAPRGALGRLRAGALRLALVAAVAGAIGACNHVMPSPVGMTAASTISVTYNPAAPFSVGIIPDRAPPVHIGDLLGFTLSSSDAGYGHLYLLTASGSVLVLAENMPLAAGSQNRFPQPGSPFRFRAQPPAGVERLLLLVTRQPFQGFGGTAVAAGPVQLSMKAFSFVEHLNSATSRLPDQGWALAETRIQIVEPST